MHRQAQGRYDEAAAVGRRGFERMRGVEPAPASGVYFALQCALAGHVGVSDEAAGFARQAFEPPPRFRTMAKLSRAYLLLRAGLADEAAASYQQAGPIVTWSLPAFFLLPAYVYAALAAAGFGRADDLVVLLDRLGRFRGEHAVGNGVAYLGPVDLTLGRGAAALGHLGRTMDDLAGAVDHADRLARGLAMTAYTERTAALVRTLDATRPAPLSRREAQVADLVAEGLTNRQIAERLVISERTAQNHVQHILAKLGFATRSQIAAWTVRSGRWSRWHSEAPLTGQPWAADGAMSTAMSDPADSPLPADS